MADIIYSRGPSTPVDTTPLHDVYIKAARAFHEVMFAHHFNLAFDEKGPYYTRRISPYRDSQSINAPISPHDAGALLLSISGSEREAQDE